MNLTVEVDVLGKKFQKGPVRVFLVFIDVLLNSLGFLSRIKAIAKQSVSQAGR